MAEIHTPQTASPSQQGGLNRRQFLGSVAATSLAAGLTIPRPVWGQTGGGNKDTVNLAIVGTGRQGRIILKYALEHMDNVNFVAVCDIWDYSKRYGVGLCKRYDHDPQVFDHHKEMLAQMGEKIDGVLVAVPDMHHAEVSIDCLEAGLHVYCEKEMSTNLEDAARMVRAQRETGKLLQIGHQRRSNPFYKHAYGLIHDAGYTGQITHVKGQWHQMKPVRPVPEQLQKKWKIDDKLLKEHGFEDMAQFYYWRWFRDLAGGPMADLGSHQVDIFNWFLKGVPSRIIAFGGNEWAKQDAKKRDAGYAPTEFDHTLVTYQYDDTAFGPVSGQYSVVLSSSKGGFYEDFMGDGGTVTTAEVVSRGGMHKEQVAEELDWEDELQTTETETGDEKGVLDPARSLEAGSGENDEELQKMKQKMEIAKNAPHLPHEQNFIEAIRGNEELNCPADGVGYETAVTALKAHEAAVRGEAIQLSEADFHV
jgi:predicted dehydrogenase